MQEPLLHSYAALRRTWASRIFALIYFSAVLTLLHRHFLSLLHSTIPVAISLLIFLADCTLAFFWVTCQSFRIRPIRRKTYPENLTKVVGESEFPAMDVFICTADPDKEPPVSVVNTALSVLAYDYPPEKLSVYVSDDGGSKLTLFAFVEAAKFAGHWLPYCKRNNIEQRCPSAYFESNPVWLPEIDEMKDLYKNMKITIEKAVQGGIACCDYDVIDANRIQAFSKWNAGFTHRDHSAIIQVLLENGKDKDIVGHEMPNLIYVSREKSSATPHNFKAGALNVLVRVSATMTNAPIILTLDCDMYSNDAQTPRCTLCYFVNPCLNPSLGFVQFPQCFHGINKNDVYASEFKFEAQIDPLGMDGVGGPCYTGTGAFFNRRALFGGPMSFVSPEIPELSPLHTVNKAIGSEQVLALAHRVAGCTYEAHTKWGSKVGFRYGTLVEDMYTGYMLHCEGWRSIFCRPKRAAFLGNSAMTLIDLLNQMKRWYVGFLEVGFGKHGPMTFGVRFLNPFLTLSYMYYFFGAIRGIAVTIYAFLPQLALLNSFSLFPKVSDPWFFLYAFLFLGAYAQDFLEFTLERGTVRRWWNNQRMWILRGLTCFTFAITEYVLKALGIATVGFNVTSKVVDTELAKRYDRGMFEFGAESPMLVPVVTSAMINLISFLYSINVVVLGNYARFEELFVQIFLAGFGMVNGWPIYEAMVLRTDPGRMPIKITLVSVFLAWILYSASSLAFY